MADTSSVVKRCFQLLAEFLKLMPVEIADGRNRKSLLRPVADIKALHYLHGCGVRLGRRSGNKKVNDVGAAPIDNYRHNLAADRIEAAADQGEPLRGQIDNGRGNIEPSVKPRLHGVLVADHILPVAPSTIIAAVMCGCNEQKYS